MSYRQDMERLRAAVGAVKEEPQGFGVVMMGSSGVGKTVLMTTMLAPLLARSRGLSVRCQPEASQRILAGYEQLTRGRLPAGTAAFAGWDFAVCHDDRPIFSFRWIDYRGGELLSFAPQSQAGSVYDNLLGAMAVLVLLDAEQMMVGGSADVTRTAKQIRKVIEISLQRQPRPLYVGLLLTKCDACFLRRGLLRRRWDEVTMTEVARRAFAPFADLEQGHPELACEIIPVSSLGRSAVYRAPGRLEIKPGPIRSFQVDVPLRRSFQVMLSAIERTAPEMEQAIEDGSLRASALRRQASALGGGLHALLGMGGSERHTRQQLLDDARAIEIYSRGLRQLQRDLRALLAEAPPRKALVIRRWTPLRGIR